MCEYVTHPEHWPGDQGDVVAALGDQCRRGTITIRYGDQPYGGVLSSYDMVGGWTNGRYSSEVFLR